MLYHCLFSVPPLNVTMSYLCYLCIAQDDGMYSHSEFDGKKKHRMTENSGEKKHKEPKSVELKIVQQKHKRQTAYLKIFLGTDKPKSFYLFT